MFLLSKYRGDLAAHIRRFSFLLKNRLFWSTSCQFEGAHASVCVLVCGAASAVWSSMPMHCIKCLRWDTSAVSRGWQMAYLHHWSADASVEGHVLKAEEEVPTPSMDICSNYSWFYLSSHLSGLSCMGNRFTCLRGFLYKTQDSTFFFFSSLCVSLIKSVPRYKVTFTLHLSAVTLRRKRMRIRW